MKQKLNYWVIYFSLTVGLSFLFSGGIFAGHTGVRSLNKGGLGTIKLSVKTPAIYVEGRNLITRHQVRKYSGKVNWARIQKKGER